MHSRKSGYNSGGRRGRYRRLGWGRGVGSTGEAVWGRGYAPSLEMNFSLEMALW